MFLSAHNKYSQLESQLFDLLHNNDLTENDILNHSHSFLETRFPVAGSVLDHLFT